jgi:hypothetical protein
MIIFEKLDEDALRSELVAARRQISELTRERDEAQAEITEIKNNRLISAIFGHHEGAPKPFSLYRPGTRGRGLAALGAEFPDGAVALRLANDGGWTTATDGGAEQFRRDGIEIVWLSDELESLAEMEQQLERAETHRDSLLALEALAKTFVAELMEYRAANEFTVGPVSPAVAALIAAVNSQPPKTPEGSDVR